MIQTAWDARAKKRNKTYFPFRLHRQPQHRSRVTVSTFDWSQTFKWNAGAIMPPPQKQSALPGEAKGQTALAEAFGTSNRQRRHSAFARLKMPEGTRS